MRQALVGHSDQPCSTSFASPRTRRRARHWRNADPDADPRNPATPRVKLEYRPDVDGLRAVAVIAVIIYHVDDWRIDGANRRSVPWTGYTMLVLKDYDGPSSCEEGPMVPCMGAGPREAARGRVDLKRGAGINNVPTRAKKKRV